MADINNLTFDSSSFKAGAAMLIERIKEAGEKAEDLAALELARLSIIEVPHDVGMLQDSQSVGRDENGAYVGYNMVYAAHLHEHPEYHFQNARKGKYLEDPLKNNLERLQTFMSNHVRETLAI